MRKYFTSITFFFITSLLTAQIVTNNGTDFDTAQELLDILTDNGGSGITVSNPVLTTSSSFSSPAGFFEGNSNLGFNSGIILATGGILSAQPDGASVTGSLFNFDPDVSKLLDQINSTQTSINNLIVLEFDFQTSSDEFSLDYIFASNEYTQNSCLENPDVFGILLSGNGINGPFSNNAKNIALVPDISDPITYSDTPVGINSVNSGITTNSAEFCNFINPDWASDSLFYVNNSDMLTVNYPGFTVPLSVHQSVEPCELYHMKIVLADISSTSNTSALFFEQSSFTSAIETNYIIESNLFPLLDANLYEGCDGASLTIFRPDNLIGDIPITYGLQGSAEYLEDYTLTNGTVNSSQIDSGYSSVTLLIDPIEDYVLEANESLVFKLYSIGTGCGSTSSTIIEMTIADQPLLNISVTDDFTNYCPGDDAELKVNITGGVGSLLQQPSSISPYSIEWSQIGTAAEQFENPFVTSEYCVEVTDLCGSQIERECVTVYVNQYEDLEANTDIVYLCSDIEAELCVEIEGGEGNYDFDWSNGSNDSCIFDFNNEYTLVVSDGCDQEIEVSAEIYLDEAPDPFFEHLAIPHMNNGVEFNNYTPEMDGLSYFWIFDDGFASLLEQPIHQYDESGTYAVSLEVTTELASCSKTYQEFISVEPSFNFYAPNAFSPNSDNKNDTFKVFITGAEEFKLIIFDSFGKQVFYSLDSNDTWDGNYEDDSKAPQGLYTYKATIKKINDIGYYKESGSINLIR